MTLTTSLYLACILIGIVLILGQLLAPLEEPPADIEPMTSAEYEAMHGWGEFPERFWDREIAKLHRQYANDEISAKELGDLLDDMMGISRLEVVRALGAGLSCDSASSLDRRDRLG